MQMKRLFGLIILALVVEFFQDVQAVSDSPADPVDFSKELRALIQLNPILRRQRCE